MLALLAAGLGWVGWELARLPGAEELTRLGSGPARDTAIMRARARDAARAGRPYRVRQQWIELDRVSRPAVTAILTSEDARFYQHAGLDPREINEAVRGALEDGKPLRGASTLTQQVAKNVYLGEDRSLLRKAKEAWLSWRLEQTLSKRRILRLYLNIAEWGEGVFGIEAAAQAHFKKHASELSLAEGAALAAMLPNPHRFSPRHPGALRRRTEVVLERLRTDRAASPEELAQASVELDRWLGPVGGGKSASAAR